MHIMAAGVGSVVICEYIEWNTQVAVDTQNSITLYNEVRMCGPAVQMETFIIYDKVRSAVSHLFSSFLF